MRIERNEPCLTSIENKKYLKKITINKTTFTLDHKYQLIVDLVSKKFEKQTMIIEKFFGQDIKMTKMLIDQCIKEGCIDDPAFTYFLAMALQNFGELRKAEKLILELYNKYPEDIIARCAYANNFMFFSRKIEKIDAIIYKVSDLEKLVPTLQLPLITFIHFVSILCSYYFIKNDIHKYMENLAYLVEAAPYHEETQRLVKNINEF